MKKNITIKISRIATIISAIKTLSALDKESQKPQFDLPFRLNYCLGRTLKNLEEAMKPAQEENERIFKGWDEFNDGIESSIKSTEDPKEGARLKAKRQKEWDARSEEWKKAIDLETQVDVFTPPKLTDDEKEKLASSGITAKLVADLEEIELFNQFDDDESETATS